jgi:predicted double-glycine peptidase
LRKSITQEFDYGCGIACFAFALNISYKQAVKLLGPKQTVSNRFWVKDLTAALNRAGLKYKSRHINDKLRRSIYNDGTIVLYSK